MTLEIFRVVDFPTKPQTDSFQVQLAAKQIAYFDTGPGADSFVRGYEAGVDNRPEVARFL